MRAPSVLSRGAARFVLALLSVLTLTGWAPSPQEGDATVRGLVTNLTPGGVVPEALPVALHVSSGQEETETHATTLLDDGSFRFDGLSLKEGVALVARVTYQDVTYVSDPVTWEQGQQDLSLPVTVYETTDDPSSILVAQLHFFISAVEQYLQIGEFYLISNTGNRTFVGVEGSESVRRMGLSFTLPEGAQGLTFDGPGLGERYLAREGGLVDTEPVLPGAATAEVYFSYVLPNQEGVRVERLFDAPVASVVLMVAGEDVAVQGDGLVSAGTLDTEMGPALSYTAGPLDRGQPFAFTVGALSTAAPRAVAAASTPDRSEGMELAIGLAALAMAAGVTVYLMLRPHDAGQVPARARPLVAAVAALDADFEAGLVSQGAHRRKRRALKRRLRALLVDPPDSP